MMDQYSVTNPYGLFRRSVNDVMLMKLDTHSTASSQKQILLPFLPHFSSVAQVEQGADFEYAVHVCLKYGQPTQWSMLLSMC